ncbi:MAG: glycoside hydrolase family 16 protein [Bacilli bacterium]
MKIKKTLQILPLLALSLLSSCGSKSSGPADSGVPDGYKLEWSDEFDGSELDDTIWTPLTGGGGWGNNELEYYQKDNATVNDGYLTITAKKERVGNNQYTSSRLVTQRKESTTYGFCVARISLPAQNAMWPAFWMLPENGSWPTSGEIDIMENRGSSAWTTSGALHHSGATSSADSYQSKSHSFSQRNGDQDITGWHTYAVLWEKEQVTWYVDGVSFFTVLKREWHPANGSIYTTDDNAPFNKPFHFILNLAVGGNFDSAHTTPDADFVSAEMKVDYVRLYSQA